MTKLSSSKVQIEKEQLQAKQNFENVCWATQQAYGDKFAKALVGYRGSKEKFAQKCLAQYLAPDNTTQPDIKQIEELYTAAYDDQREVYNIIPQTKTNDIVNTEKFDLLAKRIAGSSETPVGKFIEYLQNSDWVKQGLGYAKNANGKCPYCQQVIPDDIQYDLTNFFDESYEREYAQLNAFSQKYSVIADNLLKAMQAILENKIPILEYDLFNAEVESLSKTIAANRKALADKIQSPGMVITIESIFELTTKINAHLNGFNEKINRNNAIVKNQSQNQTRCTNEVWSFFVYELREVIAQYQKKTSGLESGHAKLLEQIRQEKEKVKNLRREIAEKEETLTSIMPTVNAINAILDRFGFTGFKIAENPVRKGTYKIIRLDGSDAKKTLSEGEHNFITFLYFFHLVYGSFGPTGIAQDKIVVIDDPISSLDSNALFIITTLVKTLLNDCIENKNGIKQVFVLTHNVYFHKEITFRGSRSQYPSTETAYWVIRKREETSTIKKFDKNPIQTSYELLWADLKDSESAQRVAVFNTLRRILEYYFNIIGGLDYERCINEFEGQDKIICKALIANINDGSHFISDDFVMCYESDTLENYLRVFRLIFDKMGHTNHYRMMMKETGELYAETTSPPSAVENS